MSYNTRRGRRKDPNAALYVGYVEDFETPEMIMRKFEELEKLKKVAQEQKQLAQAERDAQSCTDGKKSGKCEVSSDEDDDKDDENNDNSNDQSGLTEEQLAAVFMQTSTFSVSSVKTNNQIMWEKPIMSEDGFVMGYENCANIDGDNSDENFKQQLMLAADFDIADDSYDDIAESDFFEDPTVTKKSRRSGKSGTAGAKSSGRTKGGGGRAAPPAKDRIDFGKAIGADGGRRVYRRKRICSDAVYSKMPPFPIPVTWVHTIQPFSPILPHNQVPQHHYKECDVLNFKAEDLPHQDYMAVLIDAPFILELEKSYGSVTMEQFRKLPIGDIVKNGIIFIWAPAELNYEIVLAAESWGFSFVEHATWVKKSVTNRFYTENSKYLNIAKADMLLFRRVDHKKNYHRLELRHQRTSDVYFGFRRKHPQTGEYIKPMEFAYDVIETMLPNTTRKRDEKNVSTMLALWAPKSERRQGWTMLVDNGPSSSINAAAQDVPPSNDANAVNSASSAAV